MKLVFILLYFNVFFSFILDETICSFIGAMKKKGKTKEKMSLFEFNKKMFENKFKSFFINHVGEKFKFVEKTNKISKKGKKIRKIIIDDDNVLTKGWVKYLEISEDSRNPPSNFVKNRMYFLQMSENVGINTVVKDNIGFVNIPNEEYFYAELTESNLKLFTSRNERYKRLEKILKISDLVPQESFDPCKGGVEDVGNFEEGYCFMVKYTNYSKFYIWELCTDSVYEKDKWMRRIEDLNRNKNSKGGAGSNSNISSSNNYKESFVNTINIVRPVVPVPHVMALGPHPAGVVSVHGPIGFEGYQLSGTWSDCSKTCGAGVQTRIWICSDERVCKGKRLEERMCNLQACKDEIETGLTNLKKATEGQWEYLGTWSECSTPCGGGIQTITRRCLSGTCTGTTIVTQPCNTFECPNDPNSMENIRYSIPECRTLDGNLYMIVNNQMVMSHVVVNSNSLLIYPPSHPNSPMTIPLVKVIEVRSSYSHPNCFKVIEDIGQSLYLCPPQDPVQDASKKQLLKLN